MGLGAFGTTLTTLSLSLMEWRGVKTENVFVCNFFFVGALGLVITAQWEQSVGNGFAYTVFSAFGELTAHLIYTLANTNHTGLFYAGFGALLTPAFGISQAYGSDTTQYNNAVAFWMTLWTIFMFSFLIASLSANIAYIIVFIFLVLGFLFVAASYYASADGNAVAALALKKVGGAMCFVAGLTGWYIVFQIFVKNELGFELPLGDTSRNFKKKEL